MKKKIKIYCTVAFGAILMLSSIQPLHAASISTTESLHMIDTPTQEAVQAISFKDFNIKCEEKFLEDFWSFAKPYEAAILNIDELDKGFISQRGIVIGDASEKVLKAYGKRGVFSYDYSKDTIFQFMASGEYVHILDIYKSATSVISYSFMEDGKVYRIRFLFEDDKLIIVEYIMNPNFYKNRKAGE